MDNPQERLRALQNKYDLLILLQVGLAAITLFAFMCLLSSISNNLHKDIWKSWTAPIPVDGVNLLCEALRTDQVEFCPTESPVFQDVLESDLNKSIVSHRSTDIHVYFNEVDRLLKPYRTGCYQSTDEIFMCEYKFNDNSSSEFVIHYFYSTFELIEINFLSYGNPDYS